MKKLGIFAFIWLIAFARANADQTDISEEESTEKSNGFKSSSSSFTRSSSQALLQQSSFEDQESKFQEQQLSSLEQSSLQEQDSSFQEEQEQSLSKEQKSMHQVQKSSFHEEQSSLKEEKTLIDQQQLSIEEQQSSLKEQKSSLNVQQSSFQEQQSSFQKQQSSFQKQQSSFQEQVLLLKEQKSIVEEQESFLKEQKSTLREQSLLKEQRSTYQEQQSLLEEKKSTDQEQQSLLKEKKSTVHQQQSLLEEQKSTEQEQQSLLEEKKSTIQQQESLLKEQKSVTQKQQSLSKEQKSTAQEQQSLLEEQKSTDQEQQSLSKEQKSMYQEQKSSFHDEQSLLKEEKTLFDQQQLSIQEQQSSSKEQQSSLKLQQSSFQEQQSSFQEQESLLKEQKDIVEEKEPFLKEQKSTLREQSLLKEQKSTYQEQQSLLDEKKSTVHQQESLLKEQKSVTQKQQSLSKEQKSTAQEQQSLLEEQKSTEQEQQSLFQDKKLSWKEQQLSLHKQQSSLRTQQSSTFEKHQSQHNKERSSLKKQESTVSVNQKQFKQDNIREEGYSSVQQNENYLSSTKKSGKELEQKTQQAGQPESVWIGNTPDSHVYTKIIDLNKKANNSENRSKSVVNDQEEGSNTNFVRKTNTRQSGRPESVWIGNTPDSNVYTKIIDVNKEATSSKNTSKSADNKQEEDRTTNVVKKTNTKQASQPESVWIGSTPDSNVYTKIIDVNKKATSSKNTSKSAVNKQEEDRTTNVVKKTNTKQASQPESVWIGNTPDSNVYTKIIDINKKATSSENTSKSIVNKQDEDSTTYVLRKTNDKQADQPESVWIGNTPDSHIYPKVIDINEKANNSENRSQYVVDEQEEGSNTYVVRKTNTRQSGRPESVWIGNTPDSNVYTKIIDVNKKSNNSENTSKSAVNKQEEDRTTNAVKKANTKQAGQPESVLIDNTPDSNVYTKIIDVNKKAISSENTSKSVVNKKDEDSTTYVLRKTNDKQADQPESVWIDNTPDSNVYTEIIDIDKKATSSENTSKSVVNKEKEGSTTNVVRKTNTKKTGQHESVWIGNTPDSNVYTKIIDTNKKAINSESTATETLNSKSSTAAQVTVISSQAKYQNKPIQPYPPRLTLRTKLPVKSGSNQSTQPIPVKQYQPRYNLPPKTGTKKPIQPKLDQPKYNQVPRPGNKQPIPPGYKTPNEPEYNKKYQPESVWIGKTPDPKEYKIYYANKKDSKHEERDDEYYRKSSEYDVSTTETEKVVRGIRMELNLHTVFLDYGKNSDCFCSCSTDKSPFFVSIPRNKVKSYLNEML